MTAIGAAQLSDYHVTQLTDLEGYVPGLEVNSGGSPGQTTISIRGIGGLDNNATASTYIDETPIGATSPNQRSGTYALDILPYDVQSIEVLAGPQGTLYGANAFGGVVKYNLLSPSLRATDIRVGAETFAIAHSDSEGGAVRALVSTPIIAEKLGLLLSYSGVTTPGFIDNATTGQKDQNGVKQQAARISILYQPTDDLKIKFGALYSDIDSKGNATVALDNSSNPKPLYAGYTDNNAAPNIFKDRMFYYSLDVNWDLKWAKLVSATSLTKDNNLTEVDGTATYFGVADYLYNAISGGALDPTQTVVRYPLAIGNQKFTQEFRLSSEVGNLEWMSGVYYDSEKGTNTQTLNVLTQSGAPVPIVDPLFDGSFPVTYTELAAFANFDYHFTSKLDLAVGLRYAYNRQSYAYDISPITLSTYGADLIPPGSLLGHSQQAVPTYNISPRYQINSGNMVYLRLATGYQAGGPNIAIFGSVPQIQAARITTYEAGWKATFPSLNTQFNLAVYDNEWSKIQIAATAPGGVGIVLNGGNARSTGVTLDGTVRPFAGLTLSGNVAYTDAKLVDDADASGGPGGFSGDALPQQPRWAGALQANYKWNLANDWSARLGGAIHMTDSRWMNGTELTAQTINGTTLNPGDNRLDDYKLPGYASTDINADVEHGNYVISLYVKNAFDKKAYLTSIDVPDGFDNTPVQREATVLRPRTVGISVDAKF